MSSTHHEKSATSSSDNGSPIEAEMKRQSNAATAARKEKKNDASGKEHWWITGIFILIPLGLWWKSLPETRGPTPQGSIEISARATSVPVLAHRLEAVWKSRAADGSIPADTWSEWVYLDLDCTLAFYLDDTRSAEWMDMKDKTHSMMPGEYPEHVQAFRFKVLTPGVMHFQYKKVCS